MKVKGVGCHFLLQGMKVKSESEKWKWRRSVVSNSSWPHGLQPIRLLHPWDFPGKSTGVGCHCLLRDSEKVDLKLNIQKTNIMASGPIISCMTNRWGNSGNSERLFFGGSEITTDGDCSHEIKRHLLLGRKVMTNLDNIFESRDVTLPTNVHLVKAMVFPVVMYGCENWTIKKAEHWRIGAFELQYWRRLLMDCKEIKTSQS